MKKVLIFSIIILVALIVNFPEVQADPQVGELVHQLTVPVSGVPSYCSIGLAFDGESLYYDRCGDPKIYKVNPISGALEGEFDTSETNTTIPELPNALSFDKTRNGIWIGAQSCNSDGMPIYFWDLDDDTITHAFTISSSLINPATGQLFLDFCFTDGLAFDANEPTDPNDDELWFSDDVNRNIGVFKTEGTLLRGYDGASVDPSLVTTSGLAIGGDFLYLANNGGGDVFRADKTKNPLEEFDQFTSNDIRQEDMECDQVTFAPKEVMWVRTTPQGGQFPDVISAYEIEPGSCGSGGAPSDTDSDGLYDVWESPVSEGGGFDYDGDGTPDVDLYSMGARSYKKDIFVEIDWMENDSHSHKPDQFVITRLIDVFADAPVSNPDGSTGINIHIDFGDDSLGENSEGGPIPHTHTFGTGSIENGGSYDWTDFDDVKAEHFSPERTPVFHYVVFAHQLFTIQEPGKPESCGPSGVSRDAPASDFIVALGGYLVDDDGIDRCDPNPSSTNVGLISQQGGTFMHELGHNLGLDHGGGDGINHKPNYMSVMNYAFQMKGLLIPGKILQFDFSRHILPNLNDHDLNEADGIQGEDNYKNYRTLYFCAGDEQMQFGDADGSIDWNCDGGSTDENLSADINNDQLCIGPGLNEGLDTTPQGDDIVEDNIIKNGPNGICETIADSDDTQLSTLIGYDDWSNLKFDGGLIGLGSDVGELPVTTSINEMTPEDAAMIPQLIHKIYMPHVNR